MRLFILQTKSFERNASNESQSSESPRPQLKPKPSEARNADMSSSGHHQPQLPPSQHQQFYQQNVQPAPAYASNMQFQQNPHEHMFPPQQQHHQLALYQVFFLDLLSKYTFILLNYTNVFLYNS